MTNSNGGRTEVTEYLTFQSLSNAEPFYGGICELHDSLFANQDSNTLAVELAKKPSCLIVLAVADDQVVGYKIGYEERTARFYSWLGGVHPKYRGQGIASDLMRKQHEWCRDQGYTVIRTHTKNKWRDMLILNLRYGFDVVGTFTDERGEPKIILQKRL